ncbi:hypothetical protein BKI52_10055 [marine bacterium AO1-C]|nr:hypothetical protein BKI52_10055 [marine bacterium AO1-C]
MKNILLFHLGIENIGAINNKLNEDFDIKFFSYVKLIEEELRLKSTLGAKTHKYIKERYLPDTEVYFELLESYFKRSTDAGMLFSPFFELEEYLPRFIELHQTFEHSLYIIHFDETFEQTYKMVLENNLMLKSMDNFEEVVMKRAKNHYLYIQLKLDLTKNLPNRLVLNAHLPLEDLQTKIATFYTQNEN